MPVPGKVSNKRYPSITYGQQKQLSTLAKSRKCDIRICSSAGVIKHPRVKILLSMCEASNFDAMVYFPQTQCSTKLHQYLSSNMIVIVPTFRFLCEFFNVSFFEKACDAYNGPCTSLITYFDDYKEFESLVEKVYNDGYWVERRKRDISGFMATYDKYVMSVWASFVS